MLFCLIDEKWYKMKVGFIKRVRMFILWIVSLSNCFYMNIDNIIIENWLIGIWLV